MALALENSKYYDCIVNVMVHLIIEPVPCSQPAREITSDPWVLLPTKKSDFHFTSCFN